MPLRFQRIRFGEEEAPPDVYKQTPTEDDDTANKVSSRKRTVSPTKTKALSLDPLKRGKSNALHYIFILPRRCAIKTSFTL